MATEPKNGSKFDSLLSTLQSKLKDATESAPSAKTAVLSLLGATCVVSLTMGVLVYRDILKNRRSTRPLKYKPTRPQDASDVSDRTAKDIVKDRFVPGKTKIPKQIDYIVIGSGIGGLACAAFLAKVGKKCLVLEQHDRLGGCMHQFGRTFGWDVGIHYVGHKHKYERMLNCITDPESPAYPINMVQMGDESDGYTFDKYVIGTGPNKVEFSARPGKRMDDLRQLCKGDAAKIETVNKLEKLMKLGKSLFVIPMMIKLLPSLLGRFVYFICSQKFASVWNKSIAEVLDDLKCGNSLAAMVLFAMIGNLGGSRARQPFILFSSVFGHYGRGGFYFEGGPQQITRAIMPVIEKAGGRCIANAGVTEILFNERGRAVGVTVERAGKKYNFYSRQGVISAAGFRGTFTKLAPLKTLPAPASYKASVQRVLDTVPPSVQHFHIFLGFNKSSRDLALPSHNRWVFRFPESETDAENFDYDGFWRRWYADPLGAPVFGFVGFPSAKDPAYDAKFGEKSICVVLTEIPRKYFEPWAHETSGAHSEEYEALKKKIGDRLVEELVFKDFPQLRDCVEKTKYGTALSGEHYLGNLFGESYGLENGMERMFDRQINGVLKPTTPVEGLYITGQDIVCAGWAGGLHAAQITAESILGYHDTIGTVLSGRNLCKDIERLEGRTLKK